MVLSRKTYKPEHVKNALAAYFCVRSLRKAAQLTGVPKSTLHGWNTRLGNVLSQDRTRYRRRSGNKRREKNRQRRDDTRLALREMLLRNPFQNLKSLQLALSHKDIHASLTSVYRAISDMNFSFRNVSWRTPPRDVSREKNEFWNELRKLIDQGINIVSIDETGFLSNDLPRRGYGPVGTRLFAEKRHPKRFRASSVMAIGRDGSHFSLSVKG